MPDRNYHEDCMQSEYNVWQIEAAEVLNAADALSQQDGNEAASTAQDEREAFEARIVLEGGPTAVDLWISGNPDAGYSNERVNDYRFGWVACLEWIKGQQSNKN